MYRSTHQFITTVAAFLFAALAANAQTQPTYSLDYQGPPIGLPSFAGPCIKEGDIFIVSTPPGLPLPGPLPVPTLLISGGRIAPGLALPDDPLVPCHPAGLLIGYPGAGPVEVDAISYGDDFLLDSTDPSLFSLTFSVDEFAVGIASPAPPNVFTEAGAAEASSDIFLLFPPVAQVSLPLPPGAPGNTQLFDGDGVGPPGIIPPLPFGGARVGLGLTEPNPPGPALPDAGSNLDAWDADTINPPGPPAPYPVFFSLDSAGAQSLEGPVAAPPHSGSAFGNGFLSGMILLKIAPIGPPAVFAMPATLGLDLAGPPGSDDLDALAIAENGTFAYEPSVVLFDWVGGATDMVLFSVTRDSAVIGLPDSCFGLPIQAGDVLTSPIVPGFSPFPCIFIAAENLGLVTARGFGPGDELDALDVSADCNSNLIPDRLDIAYGISADANGNLIPDTCECVLVPAAPMPEPFPVAKNRFISFVPGNPGVVAAIRVTMAAVPNFPACTGGVRWVGAPAAFTECGGAGALDAAPLVAAPLCMDWGALPLLNVYGAEIAPDSAYVIEMIECTCDFTDPASYSAPLAVVTGDWGDITAPFGAAQPNFIDISAEVNKFMCAPGALSKSRTKLQPNLLAPAIDINFLDIAQVVNAFKGLPYPFPGPAVCP